MAQKISEIRSLTGLRGLAALYVVIFHALILPATSTNPMAVFLNNGYLAVDVFFILSGFVMGLVHGRDFEGGFNLSAYKKFLTKRLARIYPLYFVVLSVTLALYIAVPARIPEGTSAPNFLQAFENYFLIQAWGLNKSFVAQSWSISTEFGAYLLFPVLIYAALSQSIKRTLIIAVLVPIGIIILPFIFQITTKEMSLDIWQGNTLGPICRCVLEFTIGLLCYRFFQIKRTTSFLNKEWLGLTLAAIISALLFVKNSDIAIVLILPFFILSLTSDKTVLARFFGNRLIHWLGLISYSVYLVHNLVFYFREDIQAASEAVHIPHAYTFSLILCLPLVICAGALTYYGIEKPMRDLIRKRSSAGKQPMAEAIV